MAWRTAWADVSNRYLERAGHEERINHRSNAVRGLDEIPTIHEGPVARQMEAMELVSDRCEINRQTREQNKLIRAIRAEITKLTNAIMTSVTALAKALETARKGILLLRYSWLYYTGAAKKLDERIQEIQSDYERSLEIRKLLREKSKHKKALTAELKALSPTSFLRRGEIKCELAAVTEDMEELKSEMSVLLAGFDKADPEHMKEVKQRFDAMTANKAGLERVAANAAASMDAEIVKYSELQEQAETVDTDELLTARMELRGGMTVEVREKIKNTCGRNYDYDRFRQADRDVSALLGEPHPDEQRSVIRKLHRAQEQPDPEKQNRKNKRRSAKAERQRLFSGLLYCADCGSKLNFATCKSFEGKQDHYVCSKYKNGRSDCPAHYIRKDVLRELMLERIQAVNAYIRSDMDGFQEEWLHYRRTDQERDIREDQKRVEQAKKRLANLDVVMSRL
ncbi:MobA/MobL family protein [Ligaoa zhengdingensis]|uniref:MobA/MobL family protein n=1 Tax=Ligaoa zhengdingensis TaxID=2763658 RepID=UPI0031BB04A9